MSSIQAKTKISRQALDAFCLSNELGTLISQVSASNALGVPIDRIDQGSVREALALYKIDIPPSVVVVEAQNFDNAFFDDIKELVRICQEMAGIVVVAGWVSDMQAYRQMMRIGVADYIVMPINERELVDSMRSIINIYQARRKATLQTMPNKLNGTQAEGVDVESVAQGKIYSVIPAKGGVGSSIFAQSVASMLSTQVAKDTLLVDLDGYRGTSAINLNLDLTKITYGSGDAMRDRALDSQKLKRVIQSSGDYLKVLSTTQDNRIHETNTNEDVQHFLKQIRSDFEHVVLDFPSNHTPSMENYLAASHKILIVAEPDIVNLRNAYNLMNWITSINKNLRKKDIILLINKCNMSKRVELSKNDFINLLKFSEDRVMLFDHDPKTFSECLSRGILPIYKEGQKNLVAVCKAIQENWLDEGGNKIATNNSKNNKAWWQKIIS